MLRFHDGGFSLLLIDSYAFQMQQLPDLNASNMDDTIYPFSCAFFVNRATQAATHVSFQQLSEFLGVDGIDIVGPLPADIQTITAFTAGVSTRSALQISFRPRRKRQNSSSAWKPVKCELGLCC